MKPYLREKYFAAIKAKKDYHPRPKNKIINWWEDFDNTISRKVSKQNLMNDIYQEILDK